MKDRYYLLCCGSRGGIYSAVDRRTKKHIRLQTGEEAIARRLLFAKSEAERQPSLNLHVARAYLAGSNLGLPRIPPGSSNCSPPPAGIASGRR